tara:strand:+ start:372 stop:497 length:126 start_codon:yes stop_codon:yes gene_type:complete
MGVGNVGDSDIVFMGNKGFKVEEDLPESQSSGFLYDATGAN